MVIEKVKTTSHRSQAVACNSFMAIKWQIMIGAMLNQSYRLYAPTGTDQEYRNPATNRGEQKY